MYKSSILVVFLITLSLCSSLSVDEELEDVQYYMSSAYGFWPMPGGNIANNGYTDMGAIEFNGATTTLNNDEGETRTPPILDRNGFVYTVQRTNDTKNVWQCSIEAYDPANNDKHLWTMQLNGYPLTGPCLNALLVLNSGDLITAVVDGYLFQYQLTVNHTQPLPTNPHILPYTSSILIPISTYYFIIDDLTTNELHLIYYQASNCNNTGNCTNSTFEGDSADFSDFNTGLKATASSSPAIHSVVSKSDLENGVDSDPVPTFLISANDQSLISYNLMSHTQAWNQTLVNEKFMSNTAIATENNVVFVLVVSYTNEQVSNIILQGYDATTGNKVIEVTLANSLGGVPHPGRLSVDVANHVVLAMVEDAPSNNTVVYAYNYANETLRNVSLNEANFQGPMSIDFGGHYYVITSQFSGYIALRSDDLSTASKVLNTGGGTNTISRNYAALGNGTLVVSGSSGTVGFGPSTGGGSDSKTWIILLSVLGGLILIIFLIALACLIYHYYNKNRRAGYEVV